jgi:hypothetical protein
MLSSFAKITVTTETYSRTDSGKSWRSKPDTTETAEITRDQHHNLTSNDTCAWFRRLGGSETAQREYTAGGYDVTRLTSIDPSRTIKKVRSFEISM